ncbi:TetR/AcrR family transcriptional regulator [Nocardiopsis sp. NPDC050513]|uniref:TetR/AcrR family transcriptional regulator n=1 Tax=Nocardiopsis sp. NPDC050513 TaxID=3364338 RepID=UPI0037894220
MTSRTGSLDPRIARTRRDVVDATSALLLEEGWDAVTHAAVARRAGYSKATVYAHWPARLDLISASIEQICDAADHPAPTGDLRTDLRVALEDFAHDLTHRRLDRLLAGVVEHAPDSEVVAGLRTRLYETGTSAMRAVLASHLSQRDVEPALALLTGAVFTLVTFEGKAASAAVVDDLIDRVLASTTPRTD